MKRYIAKFINYLEVEKDASKHTLLNYRKDLEEFAVFINADDLKAVTHLKLRTWLAYLKKRTTPDQP